VSKIIVEPITSEICCSKHHRKLKLGKRS